MASECLICSICSLFGSKSTFTIGQKKCNPSMSNQDSGEPVIHLKELVWRQNA